MKPSAVLLAFVVLCASVGAISWLGRSTVSDQLDGEKHVDSPNEFDENPFPISESGPHPVAVVDEDSHEFGKMIVGEMGDHTFIIRNEGEAPLTLEVQTTSCKCTVPSMADGAIPPGESTEVILDWEAKVPAEAYSQYARIWTNDPENEILTLQITGQVSPLIQVRPPFPWTIGTIKEDEPSVFTGMILSGRETFTVSSIESTKDWLTAEIEPLPPEQVEQFGMAFGSGYLVKGIVRPEMVIGQFRGTLTLETDLGDGETVSGSVVGARGGAFSIIGQNWQGSEMSVRMGDVDGTEGKAVTLSLFAEKQEQPLELVSVQSVPDVVSISLKQDESFQTPVKEKYDLTFSIAPQARRGRFFGEERINLTVMTNRDEMEELHLGVEASIK